MVVHFMVCLWKRGCTPIKLNFTESATTAEQEVDQLSKEPIDCEERCGHVQVKRASVPVAGVVKLGEQPNVENHQGSNASYVVE